MPKVETLISMYHKRSATSDTCQELFLDDYICLTEPKLTFSFGVWMDDCGFTCVCKVVCRENRVASLLVVCFNPERCAKLIHFIYEFCGWTEETIKIEKERKRETENGREFGGTDKLLYIYDLIAVSAIRTL